MKHDFLLNVLYKYFGYNSFKYNQINIIDNLLKKNDTVALLPTGAGKSLLYQLPAIISQGVALIISPLLALIKDQIQQLKLNNISASFISSELNNKEQLIELEKAQQNKIKLLYISVERLNNYDFINALKYISISFIAIDEAHCITEWGNNFRPAYLNIKNFRIKMLSKTPILALTATATKQTVNDIILALGLKKYTIFQSSFKKKNLSIQIIKSKEKIQNIIYLLKKNIGSKIIYCQTRKETERITNILKKNNIFCDFFHSGLSIIEKKNKQNNWKKSDFQTLICTNSFGMGINKSNVKMVIHTDPSYSLENYYQEIGRAGRNGDLSFAYFFWNETILNNWNLKIIKSQINKLEYQKIIYSLYSIYYITNGEKCKKTFSLNIEKLYIITQIEKYKIHKMLKFLHNFNIIKINNQNKKSKLYFKGLPSQIKYINNKRYQLIELLSRKITGIFSNEISFYEKELSEKLQISINQLRSELNLLKKENWIEYSILEQNTIQFIKERNDNYLIQTIWENLKKIQKKELISFKKFKYFIEQNKYCRSRLILKYFNESNTTNCKICDICLNKKC